MVIMLWYHRADFNWVVWNQHKSSHPGQLPRGPWDDLVNQSKLEGNMEFMYLTWDRGECVSKGSHKVVLVLLLIKHLPDKVARVYIIELQKPVT